METHELKPGSVIEGPFWCEPVEVKKAEELHDHIYIVGVSLHTGNHIDRLIPKSDFGKIKIRSSELNFTADGSLVFLTLEAIRFRFASLFDPLLAMNISKIAPLPFQIEAIYGYILKLPKIRFLIADDPGAGKTIMAGLIIKELKLRGLAHRILIVVPGHLKDQWIREMREKFQETFTLIDRNFLNALYGENPWQRENQIITSIDFAKQ
ncbi:MAG: DEAD/DEAH box helicase family protein, partial [candidate division WOR-3 bacterium]